MDDVGRTLLSEVMAEARRLGLAWWERLVLILAVAFLVVAGKRLWEALPRPTEAGTDPARNDAPAAPSDADSSWQTDPEHPGGDNVGGA